MYRYFKMITNTNYVSSWKFKGLSDAYLMRLCISTRKKIYVSSFASERIHTIRSSSLELLYKEGVLKISQNPVFLLCRPEPCNFIKKETQAQIFFCEFCESF